VKVNFHNEHGVMFGVELHEIEVPGGAKLPMPHSASLTFLHEPYMPPKAKVRTVTMDGVASIQAGIDYYLVPHSPILDPRVYANSGSKVWMGVHKVTVGGEKAATCQLAMLGRNVNCSDPIDSPFTNVVVNINTVTTEATWGDCFGSFWGMGVDVFMSWAMNNAAEGLGGTLQWLAKHLWRRNVDIEKALTNTKYVDYPGKIGDAIQEGIDGLLGTE
jgi:hypothetical protein